MDARALLEDNLDLIERLIRFTARRKRLDESDVEDFASTVKLKLIEDDYGVLRKFQGRSRFATFVTVVVERMLLDYRIHHWGKWHASAEARRLGDLAVDFEELLHRDGRSIDEALPILRARHPEATRERLEQIAARLPKRRARRHMVDLSEAVDMAVEESTDERVMTAERQSTAKRLSCAMRAALAELPKDDRLLLQLQFDSRMKVADIARSLHIEQKLLYRRMEKLRSDLRAALVRAGIDPREAADLIGREGADLDFALGTPDLCPSESDEDTVATGGKVSR